MPASRRGRSGHHAAYGHAGGTAGTVPTPADTAHGPGPWSLPDSADPAATIPSMSDIRPPREPESAPETEPQPAGPRRPSETTRRASSRCGCHRCSPAGRTPGCSSRWTARPPATARSSGRCARPPAGRRRSSPSASWTRRTAIRSRAPARVLVRAHLAAHDRLEAQVLRAIAETGVHGRTRTAVLERAGLRGADRRHPRRRPRRRRRRAARPCSARRSPVRRSARLARGA